ncbi:MAG: hypothetical protein GXY48_04775 [Methanomicrobiales archaeon]|nr:hypothetical protein [Methanomicrobiales archaeon]
MIPRGRLDKNHTYEEIYQAACDILNGNDPFKDTYSGNVNHFVAFHGRIAEIFFLKESNSGERPHDISGNINLSRNDEDLFRDVFWDLFRQGIITLGMDSNNKDYPWFRVSYHGKKILENQSLYYFHSVETYETVIRENIPGIDEVTVTYLKEAMQSYLQGCVLSATVMLGVATEHSFDLLLEDVQANDQYSSVFGNVFTERTALQRTNKFKNTFPQIGKELPKEVKEGFDTDMMAILETIRNFRNESGHPSGKMISREQVYILLHLFIPCCKKIYQLREFFT